MGGCYGGIEDSLGYRKENGTKKSNEESQKIFYSKFIRKNKIHNENPQHESTQE